MITIEKSENKTNQKGSWLVLTGKDDKGQDRTWNIFDKAISDSFKGPGKYEATFKKVGQYWNMATLELVIAKDGATSEPRTPSSMTPLAISTAQNPRVVGAAAAIEAAGRIVAANVAYGVYKEVGIDEQWKDATIIAGQLFKEFGALVNPSAQPAQATPAKTEGA